jgi:hypothetical protein
MRKDTGVLHITPCAQKGTKKNYEIFFIAFELGIVFCSPCGVICISGTEGAYFPRRFRTSMALEPQD